MQTVEKHKPYFRLNRFRDLKGDTVMNLPIMGCFLLIVIVLAVIVITVNMSKSGFLAKIITNIIAGMCLGAAILFLPFGMNAPGSIFSRIVETVRESEIEKTSFIVGERTNYYFKISKEDHSIEIVPSKEQWKNTKSTDRLGYYSFSHDFTLAGHPLKLYAARLSSDEKCTVVVLFDEYYHGETNPGFTEGSALFRLSDDNGYMYGYAYHYGSVEDVRYFTYYIGSESAEIKGLYEALTLDKKYFK